MSPSFMNHVLQQLPYQLPMLAVYVVGLTFAILRHRRHPRASMFIAIGCGLLILVDMGSSLLQAWYYSEVSASRITASRYGQVMMMVRPFIIAAKTAGLALVVIAGFAGRSTTTAVGFPVGPPTLPPRVG